MSHLFTRTGLVTGALGFDPASREGSNPTAPTPKSRHNLNVWGLRTSCLFSIVFTACQALPMPQIKISVAFFNGQVQ